MFLVISDGVEGARLGCVAADGVQRPVGRRQRAHQAACIGQRRHVHCVLHPVLVDVHTHQRLAPRRHLRRLVLQHPNSKPLRQDTKKAEKNTEFRLTRQKS